MSSKYAGYMGKVMMVDLTTETATEYPWSDEERELYLGGKIMAARILCDHLTGKETAFSEENWIVISTGPLSGTGAPSSARFNVSALSPQTGILASSNCGGSFGLYLKRAGYDAIILKGKCQSRKSSGAGSTCCRQSRSRCGEMDCKGNCRSSKSNYSRSQRTCGGDCCRRLGCRCYYHCHLSYRPYSLLGVWYLLLR